MPGPVRVVKLMEYLSSCVWPALLNQWRAGDHNLLSDAHDLFAYNECRGIGAIAERALLGNSTRARAVLRQLQPLHGVLDGCSDTTVVIAALRALCSSTRPSGEITWVTLNDVLAVNQALTAARPLCSGVAFSALSFADRVNRAKELCESNRTCHQFSSFSGTENFGGDVAGAAGSPAKVAGKYDRVLLEKAKNGEWYNVTKVQLQAAHAAGETDKAILICLRGADMHSLAAGSRPKRLPPHKVFTDLLLGNPVGSKDGHLETWSVDKDLDATMAALRRAMPAFWGNRVFKHLQLDMNKAVPLKELSHIMANTSTWADKVPDFYREALLRAREADGDLGVEVHASYNHAPDSDPWANAQVVASLTTLVAGLLSDIGVRPDATVFDFTRAKPDDISSTLDVFGFMSHIHARLGALPTTASKLPSFIGGLLGDLGTNRHSVRASSDPKRALGTRFVELSSVRLREFIRYRDDQLRGREIQAQLRAAGLVTLGQGGAAGSTATATTNEAANNKRAAADFQAEVQKEVQKRMKSAAATPAGGGRGGGAPPPMSNDDVPPSVAVLLDDGKRVHITGGRRGPDGCTYLIAGPAGVARALTTLKSDVGPVWWVCSRTKMDDADTRALCAKSKWPGDGNILDDEPAGLSSLKLASFRINEDGLQYMARSGKGAGAGAGAGGRGRGRGRGGRGSGRGGAIVLAANLASGSSFVMSGAPRADVVMANAPLVPASSSFPASSLALATASPKPDAVSGKLREVADQLRTFEEAAARCDARRAAGMQPLLEDEAPASKEASLGPSLRKQLAALSGGPAGGLGRAAVASSRGKVGFGGALGGQRARAPVSFAPGTPPTGAGIAFDTRGVWSTCVGSRPARRGLEDPRIFRFDTGDTPTCATLLVPVRMDVASGLVLKPAGNALFGQSFDDEPSRDAAVSASRPMVTALLGDDAEFSVYLAGEWVDGDYRWRVVLCVVGGALGSDMATALRDGSSICRTCRWACWLRSSELAGSRAGEIALAALARARAAVRPSSELDARLRIGRGERRWADTSQDAAVASRPLLGEALPPAGAALCASVVVSNQRTGTDRANDGYAEVLIDRTTPLGNPFKMSTECLRDAVCDAYVEYIADPAQADVREIALRRGLVVDRRFENAGAAAARAMEQLADRARAGEKLNLRCWCAPRRCHGDAIAEALAQRVAAASSKARGGCDASDARARVIEHMGQAHAEVQKLLRDEAETHRQLGSEDLATFLEGCASRVEPLPIHEVPTGLQSLALTDSDIRELRTRPFARNTFITTTAAPVYKARPDAFPAHLPEPTCHASFLQAEVVGSCLDWYDDADAWHRQRMAGADSSRPKGLAYGLDALRPEWRPLFEAGGVVLFDEQTGQPTCLTTANYPLRASLNGDFAAREFADYPDQEMVAAMRDGVCIKAQGLPVLQLGCNLEALYDADGVAGVQSVAAELGKFASYDETGWLMKAPKADRGRGVLPIATLPSCTSPIGAVPKKDGGTRIITDMGFPYGRLSLREVNAASLPPEHRWDGTSPYRPTDARPYESSTTLGGGGSVALPPNVASGPSKPPKSERYTPNGPHPWPREGKCTVAEQAENDVILSVPYQLAGLPQYNLAWDFWKCFHQKHYRPYEVIATAAHVPHLDASGEVTDHLRGVTNGRMAMGGLFASGLCQRDGNAIYFKTMQRFDARQRARRLAEPESPAVASWLAARESLPHDDYGSQARLAAGGFYSDDPKITVVGPPSRVLDLTIGA